MESFITEADRSHFFLRIVVHQQPSDNTVASADSRRMCIGTLSHIHIVDLVGSSPVEGRQFNLASEEDRIARRETQLQLLSFTKVLGEMAAMNRESEEFRAEGPSSHINKTNNSVGVRMTGSVAGVALTSARDSVLSSILAPIIQGNCKTVIVGFVKDGANHINQTRSTLAALDGVTSISCAAYRVRGVSLLSLPMIDHEIAINTNYGHAVQVVQALRSNSPGSIARSSRENTSTQQQYTHSYAPRAVSNDDTDLSIDENIDLMKIASGDFLHRPKQSNFQSNADTHDASKDRSRSLSAGSTVLRESFDNTDHQHGGKPSTAQGSTGMGVLDSIMGEFHDLMAEMQSHNSVVKESVRKLEASSQNQVDFSPLNPTNKMQRPRSYLGPIDSSVPFGGHYEHHNSGGTMRDDSVLFQNNVTSNNEVDSEEGGEGDTNSANTMENIVNALEELKRSELPGSLTRQILDSEIENLIVQKMEDMGTSIVKTLDSDPTSPERVGYGGVGPNYRLADDVNVNSSVQSLHDRKSVDFSGLPETYNSRQQASTSHAGINTHLGRYGESNDGSTEAYIEAQRKSIDSHGMSAELEREKLRRIHHDEAQAANEYRILNRNLNNQRQLQHHQQHPLTVPPAVVDNFAGIGAGLYPNNHEQLNGDIVFNRRAPPVHQPLTAPTVGSHGIDESKSARSSYNEGMMGTVTDSFLGEDNVSLVEGVHDSINGNTDVAQMQRSCNALLAAIEEGKQYQTRLEAKLVTAQEEMLEMKTQAEIDIESYKVENLRLKGQIRSLCSENSIGDVFSAFEDNVTR
jgi:hypothetical protein